MKNAKVRSSSLCRPADAMLGRDHTETSLSDDDDDDDCPSQKVAKFSGMLPYRHSVVTIREDWNVEHLNWHAPKTLDELELCFVKRTDKQWFRDENTACVVAFQRHVYDRAISDWEGNDDIRHGSMRGLEDFMSPRTYVLQSLQGSESSGAGSFESVNKEDYVSKRRCKMFRRDDAMRATLQQVAACYSRNSVLLALRLAQHDNCEYPPQAFLMRLWWLIFG